MVFIDEASLKQAAASSPLPSGAPPPQRLHRSSTRKRISPASRTWSDRRRLDGLGSYAIESGAAQLVEDLTQRALVQRPSELLPFLVSCSIERAEMAQRRSDIKLALSAGRKLSSEQQLLLRNGTPPPPPRRGPVGRKAPCRPQTGQASAATDVVGGASQRQAMKEYVSDLEVQELLKGLMSALLQEQPASPHAFCTQWLERQLVQTKTAKESRAAADARAAAAKRPLEPAFDAGLARSARTEEVQGAEPTAEELAAAYAVEAKVRRDQTRAATSVQAAVRGRAARGGAPTQNGEPSMPTTAPGEGLSPAPAGAPTRADDGMLVAPQVEVHIIRAPGARPREQSRAAAAVQAAARGRAVRRQAATPAADGEPSAEELDAAASLIQAALQGAAAPKAQEIDAAASLVQAAFAGVRGAAEPTAKELDDAASIVQATFTAARGAAEPKGLAAECEVEAKARCEQAEAAVSVQAVVRGRAARRGAAARPAATDSMVVARDIVRRSLTRVLKSIASQEAGRAAAPRKSPARGSPPSRSFLRRGRGASSLSYAPSTPFSLTFSPLSFAASTPPSYAASTPSQAGEGDSGAVQRRERARTELREGMNKSRRSGLLSSEDEIADAPWTRADARPDSAATPPAKPTHSSFLRRDASSLGTPPKALEDGGGAAGRRERARTELLEGISARRSTKDLLGSDDQIVDSPWQRQDAKPDGAATPPARPTPYRSFLRRGPSFSAATPEGALGTLYEKAERREERREELRQGVMARRSTKDLLRSEDEVMVPSKRD